MPWGGGPARSSPASPDLTELGHRTQVGFCFVGPETRAPTPWMKHFRLAQKSTGKGVPPLSSTCSQTSPTPGPELHPNGIHPKRHGSTTESSDCPDSDERADLVSSQHLPCRRLTWARAAPCAGHSFLQELPLTLREACSQGDWDFTEAPPAVRTRRKESDACGEGGQEGLSGRAEQLALEIIRQTACVCLRKCPCVKTWGSRLAGEQCSFNSQEPQRPGQRWTCLMPCPVMLQDALVCTQGWRCTAAG